MANLKEVTDASYEQDVLQSKTPVLVDFWATWCNPCRQIAPVLEEIAAMHAGKLEVVKMDIDSNPVTPARYGITGIPTLHLYVDGELKESLTGVKPKAALLQKIEPHLQG